MEEVKLSFRDRQTPEFKDPSQTKQVSDHQKKVPQKSRLIEKFSRKPNQIQNHSNLNEMKREDLFIAPHLTQRTSI